MDGFRMRELRRYAGLTQAEVAKELDVTKQTVHRWEKGETRIRRVVEGMFTTLVNDLERISWIKSSRPERVRGRPFQKKNKLTQNLGSV